MDPKGQKGCDEFIRKDVGRKVSRVVIELRNVGLIGRGMSNERLSQKSFSEGVIVEERILLREREIGIGRMDGRVAISELCESDSADG